MTEVKWKVGYLISICMCKVYIQFSPRKHITSVNDFQHDGSNKTFLTWKRCTTSPFAVVVLGVIRVIGISTPLGCGWIWVRYCCCFRCWTFIRRRRWWIVMRRLCCWTRSYRFCWCASRASFCCWTCTYRMCRWLYWSLGWLKDRINRIYISVNKMKNLTCAGVVPLFA